MNKNEKEICKFEMHLKIFFVGTPVWVMMTSFLPKGQGPVPEKMVKFNPGWSEILSKVFLLRECNSSLQNTVELLLWDTVMIYTKCFSKKCIGR